MHESAHEHLWLISPKLMATITYWRAREALVFASAVMAKQHAEADKDKSK